MEDHKAITSEAHGVVKFKMQEFTNQVMLFKNHVVSFWVLLFLFWSTDHIEMFSRFV